MDKTVPALRRTLVHHAVSVRTRGGDTTVRLAVRGLLPNQTYGAHVHAQPGGVGADDIAGPHFQRVPDPRQPSTDPRYTNPNNEIWLDLTTDPEGAGSTRTTAPWESGDVRPGSVVIHPDQHRTGHRRRRGGPGRPHQRGLLTPRPRARGQSDGVSVSTAARAPLRIGPHTCDTPVVLAPMAGITNAGFRRLCREQGAGFYVCEMVTSRGLVERNPLTFRMIAMDPDEHPRSMQLYGVDPATVGLAVRTLAERDLADHIDLNFGCPVPKVTRRGGGAALPYKRRLFERIVRAAVDNAGAIPVTVKMRIGIDDERHTYLDAGHRAVDAGVAAVALHARTAAQRYSGTADWAAIARLRDALPAEVPVLGNGDIFSAADALRMVAETGCDGIVVGRGCLGRPWLFGDLEAAFAGRPPPTPASLGQVGATLRRHAELLVAHMGADKGIRDMRKHIAWYLKGFPVGPELRRRLGLVGSLDELDELLARLDPAEPFPEAADGPRGRQGSPGRVVLPERWLDDPDDPTVPRGAELEHSGG